MTNRYVILQGNTVANTAISDRAITPDWIQSDTAGIGDTWDGSDFIALIDPTPTRKDAILARLKEIDMTSDKPRTRRELAISKAATKAWLQTLDDEAAALRTELAGL